MGHPTQTHKSTLQPTSEASNKKKLPTDYDNVERWYNIGITPIRDYINHSNTYPTITDYQDTSTHERVTRVHHEMNE